MIYHDLYNLFTTYHFIFMKLYNYSKVLNELIDILCIQILLAYISQFVLITDGAHLIAQQKPFKFYYRYQEIEIDTTTTVPS